MNYTTHKLVVGYIWYYLFSIIMPDGTSVSSVPSKMSKIDDRRKKFKIFKCNTLGLYLNSIVLKRIILVFYFKADCLNYNWLFEYKTILDFNTMNAK